MNNMNSKEKDIIKKFISENSKLTYEEVSDAINKYLSTINKKVEYDDDISFYYKNGERK